MSSLQCTLKAAAGVQDFSWKLLPRGCLHAEVGSKQKFFSKQLLFLTIKVSNIFISSMFFPPNIFSVAF